jgi:hypothetical protein
MKNFIFIFLSFVSFQANSQTITGYLTDKSGIPIAYGQAMLRSSSDSSLLKGEIADESGKFSFENIKAGTYFIEIRAMGYEKFKTENFTIDQSQSTLELGKISISPSATSLQEVKVTAEKPFIERLTDRTVVNIENSPIHTGSSISEVMEKLPGVQVNQDGIISLKGKQSVTVMIDGKPTGISGQDLGNMLKGMSSSNIQKIEIITNPSAKFDAAGNAGVINIIMKKNKMPGTNGSISSGYGQGRYAKTNSSISLSHKNARYNIFMNYGFSYRKGFNNLILTRNFFYNDTLNTTFETNNYITFPFKTHTPRLGADFYLSPKTTISVLGTSVINSFRPGAQNHTDILNGKGEKLSSYDFTNQSKASWYNYAFNAQIRHSYDTTGREITADLDYASYSNNADQLFTTTNKDGEGNFIDRSILIGDQDGSLTIYSAKTDYTQPLKNKAKLEAGLKSSYVEANNDIKFYNSADGINTFDTSRSSHFIYSENINAAYINLNKDFKKLSVQFGLRAENTQAKGRQVLNNQTFNRNYLQVFPSVFFDYKFNEKHSINANVGRRIDRPAYEQMNPFRRMIDATTFAQGNPYLLPQISYNAELTYGFNNSFFITGGYSLTTDNITDVLIQDSEKKVTVQTIVNLYRFNYYNVNLTYSKRIAKWWNTNTSLLSYYGIYTGTINNFTINQGDPSFYLNTSNSFSIVEGLSMECNFIYNHKNLYGVTLMKSNYNLSLGLQKSLFNKKGSFTINVSDLLWKAYPSGITHFGNVNEYWLAKRDTRVVNANFTYRFGKGQVKARRTTGADDEKNRVGNGS